MNPSRRSHRHFVKMMARAGISRDFTAWKVLPADRCDGQSLPGSQGPFRLVLAGEKVRARWVRRVRALEVIHINAIAKP